MESPIAEIKNKLDIVEFIRSYVPLLPAGKNFKAPCPFHKEKTPSFMVSPDRQTWHCFGACSEGGDIFKFLMKYENLEFYEALKVLAEKAGIELKRLSPQDQRQFGVLYDANSLAKDFFRKQLLRRPEVLEYLTSRGLKKETMEEFEVGFAPDSFDALSLDLVNLGFDVRDIERSGLIFKNDRGRYTDRFRNRIMFPIHNSFGKIVGFSGRILPAYDTGDVGKYINSPETPIFNKSRIFYGLHKTKNNIREKGEAVLVEGQMDFLMLYQDGIKNAIATSGTALTQDHLNAIKRLTDQLVLFFDNDEAGFKAAERSIDLASANDFNVKLLILSEFKDPAEAVQKKPGYIAEALQKTIHAIEFYFTRHLGETEGDIKNFKKGLRTVLLKIKNLASPVERSHWIKKLSERANISERALMEEMEQLRNEKLVIRNEADKRELSVSANQRGNQRESAISRRHLIAERLLSLLMVKENLKEKIENYKEYLPDEYAIILKGIIGKEKIKDENFLNMLSAISLRSSFEAEELGEEKIIEEFDGLLKQIQLECLREKQQELLRLIKEAEKNGSHPEAVSALQEFDTISKLIHN
ncbi:DNA primase [Candidatus Wolfebacteria bacterium]|nr:DNA primase [Candidatus Wolfebacteria bacterium]